MFLNEASCCVCGKSNIQIHHIDGNNTNNKLKNLAVLCTEHHDQASSRSSMTRHLSAPLVRRFKSDWEVRVSKKREIARRNTIVKEEDRPFIKFEIKRLIYSLTAFPDKKTTNAVIDQLYSWHVFTDSTKNILNTFDNIRWFLKGTQISILLSRVWEFFWQFVGPEDIKMRRGDEREILIAIELIGSLGQQLIIVSEHPRVFKDFFVATRHFESFVFSYKNDHLKKALKKQLLVVQKELVESRNYPQKNILIAKINSRLKCL